MRFAGETYEQIVNGFSCDLPPRFNIATACCDGWATSSSEASPAATATGEPDRVPA